MTELLETPPIERYESSDSPEKTRMTEALAKINGEINQIRWERDIHDFVSSVAAQQGIELPDLNDPELSRDDYKNALHSVLERRAGKGRDEAQETEFNEFETELLETIKERYGMVHDTLPVKRQFDAAMGLGGAADGAYSRTAPMIEKLKNGEFSADLLLMLASAREVSDAERGRAVNSGYSEAGVPAETEFDLSKNAISKLLDIKDDEWMMINGFDDEIPEQHHYQHRHKIAYAEKDGRHVFVLSAPMIGEDRLYPDGNRRNRPNTADTMAMVARMLQGLDHTPSVVAFTDAIYQFQRPDGESMLAEKNVEYNQAGLSRATVGKPDWKPHQYSQELWSLINQTYKAHDYLEDKLDFTA